MSFDPKLILWSNVSALMIDRYGKINMQRLAQAAGVGIASIQRMRDENTSKVAGAFDLLPWQLLFPNLNPKNPPVLCITEEERALYARLQVAAESVATYKIPKLDTALPE